MVKESMKRIFYMAAMAAVMTVFVMSCENMNEMEPGYDQPDDVIEFRRDTVAAGDTARFAFLPSADWEISVPTATYSWFWLDVNGRKTNKISGKVSKDTVYVNVVISDVEELMTDRKCELSLTMEGETNVVMEYVRPALGLLLEVYPARLEDGMFVSDTLKKTYEYVSEKSRNLSLIWVADSSEFMLPVLIRSNCEWSVELPGNVRLEGPESTKGDKYMTFVGNSLSEASYDVVFAYEGTPFDTLTVSLPASGEIGVYAARYEDDELVYADGEYVYEADSLLALFWSGTDYRLPVKVDSKCEWEVDMPEWLTLDMPESTIGTSYIILKGVPSKYPMEDAEGEVKFKSGDEILRTVRVTMPGSAGRMDVAVSQSLTKWEFNHSTWLMIATGYADVDAEAVFTATSGARVLAVDVEGTSVTENPSWMHVDVSAWDESATASAIQERTVTVTVDEKTTKGQRNAFVIFLPESFTGGIQDLFTAEGTVKEEYAYVPVIQNGNDAEYIMMVSSEEAMAAAGCSFGLSTNKRLDSYFGAASYKYKLTYNVPFAQDAAHMNFLSPYKSYKVFNGAKTDVTAKSQKDSTVWFTPFSDENISGVVSMYLGKSNPPTSETTFYLVLYDVPEDEVVVKTTLPIAVVECVYDPKEIEVSTFETAFAAGSDTLAVRLGASLRLLSKGDSLFVKVKEKFGKDELPESILNEYFGVSVYHLNYTSAAEPLSILVPADASMYTVNPSILVDAFTVNDLDFGEVAGKFTSVDGAASIRMGFPEDYTDTFVVGKIFFYVQDPDSNEQRVSLIVICTLDTEGYLEYLYR